MSRSTDSLKEQLARWTRYSSRRSTPVSPRSSSASCRRLRTSKKPQGSPLGSRLPLSTARRNLRGSNVTTAWVSRIPGAGGTRPGRGRSYHSIPVTARSSAKGSGTFARHWNWASAQSKSHCSILIARLNGAVQPKTTTLWFSSARPATVRSEAIAVGRPFGGTVSCGRPAGGCPTRVGAPKGLPVALAEVPSVEGADDPIGRSSARPPAPPRATGRRVTSSKLTGSGPSRVASPRTGTIGGYRQMPVTPIELPLRVGGHRMRSALRSGRRGPRFKSGQPEHIKAGGCGFANLPGSRRRARCRVQRADQFVVVRVRCPRRLVRLGLAVGHPIGRARPLSFAHCCSANGHDAR